MTNGQELDGFCSELGALVPGGKEQIELLYREAMKNGPHAFLYVNMKAPLEKMFHDNHWKTLAV